MITCRKFVKEWREKQIFIEQPIQCLKKKLGCEDCDTQQVRFMSQCLEYGAL